MDKNRNRIIGVLMLIVAVLFIGFSLYNPQASFPFSNTITYFIYAIYISIMAILLVNGFKKKEDK